MTTFDLNEVREFVADLRDRMDRCANGEGFECATLDSTLSRHAELCSEVRNAVRQWGLAVFSGRITFNRDVEMVLHKQCYDLWFQAVDLLSHSQSAEVDCYVLDGHCRLQLAYYQLDGLLRNWVTPSPAVSAMARHASTAEPVTSNMQQAHRRISELPPLPEDWKPGHPRLQTLYRQAKAPESVR